MDFPKKPARSTQLHGQGMVEFALVIMFLVLVAFGVLDLGRAFFSLIVITNAAREGARYGVTYPSDTTGIQNAAVAEAQSSGVNISSANVTVTCRDPIAALPCPSGRPLRVNVSYTFQLFMGWIINSPIQVSRYVEMIVP
jgi:Flp pilus assembly protein TadG